MYLNKKLINIHTEQNHVEIYKLTLQSNHGESFIWLNPITWYHKVKVYIVQFVDWLVCVYLVLDLRIYF